MPHKNTIPYFKVEVNIDESECKVDYDIKGRLEGV